MNKLLAIITILTLSCVHSFAQKGAQFQFKDKNNTFDFGTVKEGVSVVHEFDFKNVGDQPLQILKVDASCGCTTPEWPKTPVLPGKTGSIKVTFDTKGRVGPAIRNINIKSNAALADKSKERVELILKGIVEE